MQGQKNSFQITCCKSCEESFTSTNLIRGGCALTMPHLPCPIGLEKTLQGRLSSISRSQLAEGQDIQNIADAADDIKLQQKMYGTEVEQVQTLVEEMKRKLQEAKTNLRSAVRHETDQRVAYKCYQSQHPFL